MFKNFTKISVWLGSFLMLALAGCEATDEPKPAPTINVALADGTTANNFAKGAIIAIRIKGTVPEKVDDFKGEKIVGSNIVTLEDITDNPKNRDKEFDFVYLYNTKDDKEGNDEIELRFTVKDKNGVSTFGSFKFTIGALGITSITPDRGLASTEITISGKGFGTSSTNAKVSFKDIEGKTVDGSIISINDSEIKTKVPTGLKAGNLGVSVAVSGKTTSGSFILGEATTGGTPPVLRTTIEVTMGLESQTSGIQTTKSFFATSLNTLYSNTELAAASDATQKEVDLTFGASNPNDATKGLAPINNSGQATGAKPTLVSPSVRLVSNGWTGFVSGDPIRSANRRSTKFKVESLGSISGVTAADVENNVTVGTLDAIHLEAGKIYSFVNADGEKGYVRVISIESANNNAMKVKLEIVVQNKG